jgi:hypothetical protein
MRTILFVFIIKNYWPAGQYAILLAIESPESLFPSSFVWLVKSIIRVRKKPLQVLSCKSLIFNASFHSKQLRKKQMLFPQFNGSIDGPEKTYTPERTSFIAKQPFCEAGKKMGCKQ